VWVSAYHWFRAGLLAVAAQRVGWLILVDELTGRAGVCGGTAVDARVSSADEKADLDGQVARVSAWATTQLIPVDRVVAGVGSALNGHRGKFVGLLGDPSVGRSWWSIGIGCAGWDRGMSGRRWPRGDAGLVWWIRPGLTAIWCGT
jgi:predicted site-specific integrase-resolvase